MTRFFGDLYKHFVRTDFIEWWFKWLEWVTLTVAVSYAWWSTKSDVILPIVFISFWYVWYSSIRGVGLFLFSFMHQKGASQKTIDNTSRLIGSILTFFCFYTVLMLFVGIFSPGEEDSCQSYVRSEQSTQNQK